MWIWEMSAEARKCVAVEERVTVRFCCGEEPIFVDYCANVHKRKYLFFIFVNMCFSDLVVAVSVLGDKWGA